MGSWLQAVASITAVLLSAAIAWMVRASLNTTKLEILEAIEKLKIWADDRYELKEVASKREEALHQRLTDLHGKRAHGSGD